MITTLILMTYLTFPSLSMAMSSVESNHNFLVTGDKGRSRGAFQVQPKIWGKVPKCFRKQMVQHDAILLELLEECGDVVQTVAMYNSGHKVNKRYVGKVTQAALQRELLGEI